MSGEKEFQSLLENLGFIVERVKGGFKFNSQTDFFGCWDLVGFNADGWLLVQCKSDYRKKVYDELKAWSEKNNPPFTTSIYAIRKKNEALKDRWEILYIGGEAELPFKTRGVKNADRKTV